MKLGLGLRHRFQHYSRELRYFIANLRRPNLYNISTPERVGVVYSEPSDMPVADRVMIYALARGLRPLKAIEIGARWGGSARIITSAMEENGVGQLVGIDPFVSAFRAKPKELHGRYKLVEGYSPEAIPAALNALGGGPVDFVFIDGHHIYDAAKADFLGVLPYLSDGAHVLLHDTFHQGINQAVEEILEQHPSLHDCGVLTRNMHIAGPVGYWGLRLIRHGEVQSRQMLSATRVGMNGTAPSFSPDFWNYDHYWKPQASLK